MAQDLGEPHDGELLTVEPGGASRGLHPGSCHPGELRTREATLQSLDECGTQRISRGLACHERDSHQRTRLRVDSLMKSTKICSSGWVAARAFNSTRASPSLRSERYNTR